MDVNLKFNKPENLNYIWRAQSAQSWADCPGYFPIIYQVHLVQLYYISNEHQYQVISPSRPVDRQKPEYSQVIRYAIKGKIPLSAVMQIRNSTRILLHYFSLTDTMHHDIYQGWQQNYRWWCLKAMREIASQLLGDSFKHPQRSLEVFEESSLNTLAFVTLALLYLILAAQFEVQEIHLSSWSCGATGGRCIAQFKIILDKRSIFFTNHCQLPWWDWLPKWNSDLDLQIKSTNKGIPKLETISSNQPPPVSAYLMTSLATSLGALPLPLLGNGCARVPLRCGCVGGILFSFASDITTLYRRYISLSRHPKTQTHGWQNLYFFRCFPHIEVPAWYALKTRVWINADK